MTLGQLASIMTRGAQIVRDVNAVKRGRVVQRVENKIIGRLVSRQLRRVWR